MLYGDTFTLSGEVERGGAGRLVVVLERRHGRGVFREAGRTKTVAGGGWTYRARPTIRTVYRARVGRLLSSPVAVDVEPRIVLEGERGRFSVEVRAARSFADKYVILQRRTGGSQWTRIRQLFLDRESSTRFRFRHPADPTQIRLLMPQSQVGPGYVGASSAVITLIRR